MEEPLFEVGKIYTTKFATKERFTITRDPYVRKEGIIIGVNKIVWGTYEKNPTLGECPLIVDRLINI